MENFSPKKCNVFRFHRSLSKRRGTSPEPQIKSFHTFMSNFNLGLPIDIPWKRLCVSEDMTNTGDCGKNTAPVWRSSLAIFDYTPPDQVLNEILPGKVVTYVKVTCSITPFAADLDSTANATLDFVPVARLAEIPKSFPCYGALLQVTVKPASEIADKNLWPYIQEVEPKKREIYEAVSETGEVLSGSSSGVSVGKSSSNTNSAALSPSVSVPIGGVPVSFGLGSVSSSTTNTSSQDSSTSIERRETQSHSTNLSQLYHLFQAFHVGTNRATFFMEPRPHTLAVPSTFINGPRELEGIQEVFLVVVREKFTPDIPFCVQVQLDTAHLYTAADRSSFNKATGIKQVSSNPPSTSKKGGAILNIESAVSNYLPEGAIQVVVYLKFDKTFGAETQGRRTYVAPRGWTVLDYYFSATQLDGTEPYLDEFTKTTITIQRIPTSGSGAAGAVELHVTLMPDRLTEDGEVIDGMFLIGRSLCCCNTPAPGKSTVVFQMPFKRQEETVPYGPGVVATENFVNSKVLSNAIKQGVIASGTSPERVEVGAVPFTQSDIFYNQLISIADSETEALNDSISVTNSITPGQRDAIMSYVGELSLRSLINTPSFQIAYKTGMDLQEVLQMKDQVMRSVMPAPTAPPSATPFRTVIGVRILSYYPTPNFPTELYRMASPTTMPTFSTESQPSIIEVSFDGVPDAGTLTTSNFYVSLAGTSLTGVIVPQSLTTFQLQLNAPLAVGGAYTLTLKGTGGTPILFNGIPLDGDPIALPSGDGVIGGDFISTINILQPPPIVAPGPPPTQTLRLIGVRIKSSTGSSGPLFEMRRPGGIVQLQASTNPDIIEVDFNFAPDGGTVSTSSFLLSTITGAIAGTVTGISGTRFDFSPTASFPTGTVINVELLGTGASAIKMGGVNLDGDPVNLPSGDGQPGGSFAFQFQVN